MRVALVPGVLALLPEYASIDDPVADLRASCLDAVGWLAEQGEVTVIGSSQGARVARHLLATVGGREGTGGPVLVVGNGSARRTERAPGHLDPRAVDFDAVLGAALGSGPGAVDLPALRNIDPELSRELWADTESIAALAEIIDRDAEVIVDYDGDPFGVQYWVIRWSNPPA